MNDAHVNNDFEDDTDGENPDTSEELSSDDGSAEIFSEDAIEQAYLQALRASEEAGLVPDLPVLPPMVDELQEPMLEAAYETEAAEEHPAEEPEEDAPKTAFKPQQIIESLLFVGGEKLPARKIASLLGQHCSEESVRNWIEEISERYRDQQRPYEIVLGEEGYQMVLRSAYQTQRHLLFGLGPKEIKLSQDALEVLALVAYEQPISQESIQELDRSGVMAAVRQLVRRGLVTFEREDKVPVYRTTDRFLQLFGLRDLTDLPRSRDLSLK